jgi:hypothetical protein
MLGTRIFGVWEERDGKEGDFFYSRIPRLFDMERRRA